MHVLPAVGSPEVLLLPPAAGLHISQATPEE